MLLQHGALESCVEARKERRALAHHQHLLRLGVLAEERRHAIGDAGIHEQRSSGGADAVGGVELTRGCGIQQSRAGGPAGQQVGEAIRHRQPVVLQATVAAVDRVGLDPIEEVRRLKQSGRRRLQPVRGGARQHRGVLGHSEPLLHFFVGEVASEGGPPEVLDVGGDAGVAEIRLRRATHERLPARGIAEDLGGRCQARGLVRRRRHVGHGHLARSDRDEAGDRGIFRRASSAVVSVPRSDWTEVRYSA